MKFISILRCFAVIIEICSIINKINDFDELTLQSADHSTFNKTYYFLLVYFQNYMLVKVIT